MNYNDAVAVYQKSPTSETLKEVCKQLCSEMTLREKLKMLSVRHLIIQSVRLRQWKHSLKLPKEVIW